MNAPKSPFGFLLAAADNANAVAPCHSVWRSVRIGMLGFGGASLLVFGSWAWIGGWLFRQLGEAGTYSVWAATFIAVAGVALRGLMQVPVSVPRFLGFFLTAFGTYALVWSVVWFTARNHLGEWFASLLSTLGLSVILCWGFRSWSMLPRVALGLFVLHSAGYFSGGLLYAWVLGKSFPPDLLGQAARSDLSKLMWGIGYGCGFGAGLGYAFHAVQQPPRQEANSPDAPVA